MLFQRKIYQDMLDWKHASQGRSALLIQGARRVGKSTIVEAFAQKEYESYLLIDFSSAAPEVRDLFEDVAHLDFLFLRLQLIYDVRLHPRASVIIFDEVQLCPKARQAIKHLVKDGRYDYIETGSLLSIRQNIANILIPSEERRLNMRPMDYEEFLWAIGERETAKLLAMAWEQQVPLGQAAHREQMRKFRLYMLIGGMPQAVETYLATNNFRDIDDVKREILSLYSFKRFYTFKARSINDLHIETIEFAHEKDNIYFELNEESDGTARLLELLEILLSKDDSAVYIVDELDRCLNPMITRAFAEKYMELAKKRNIQLIFSTNESTLLDTAIFRNDELELIGKDEYGQSCLHSMEDLRLRSDRNLFQAYFYGEEFGKFRPNRK